MDWKTFAGRVVKAGVPIIGGVCWGLSATGFYYWRDYCGIVWALIIRPRLSAMRLPLVTRRSSLQRSQGRVGSHRQMGSDSPALHGWSRQQTGRSHQCHDGGGSRQGASPAVLAQSLRQSVAAEVGLTP